ncbi:MAG TPA: helix-turn-helix transcriptional regulator [Desulfatiglandales bacterium]|nr:helix-turn-helix transcriptional regulator [Desulfatiglandales bacterium]
MDVKKRREFGEWIKSMRKEKTMSLREVSEKLGYKTRGTMAGVESGQMPLPIERIFEIAKIYEMDIKEILKKLKECEPELYEKYKILEEGFERTLFQKIRSYGSGRRADIAAHHKPYTIEKEGRKMKNNIYYQTQQKLIAFFKRYKNEIKHGLYERVHLRAN